MLCTQLEKEKSHYSIYSNLFVMLLWLQERENGHPCVRVIKPDNQGKISTYSQCSYIYIYI